MKRLNWWTTIVLLLISQAYAANLNEAKTQESDLKSDAKELIKAAASSAEYSASLANDYQNEKQQQDNVASSSSSVSTSVDSNSNYNNNLPSENQQYSQPLSYSQPGTPIQPIHSYSQPLNYAPSGLPYTSESQQISTQYSQSGANDANSQYPSLKDLAQPEIPSASASSQYYPQYPAHQQYNPHLVLQSQASAPISDYHQSGNSAQQQQSYDSNQATYVQPAQHQNVYLHHQHHVAIPGSSYSEQSYVVDNGDKNAYQQPSSYSQPLPPEYSPEYSHSGNNNNVPPPPPPPPSAPSSSNVQIKPKKTVILAIPVKLVAKNKYSGQNNNGYSSQPEIPQPHYSTNVVPAAANVPVSHSYEKSNEYEKPTFNEKPLYADKPAYTDKAEEYPKVNHNLNNNLNNNGYNGEYESENGDQYPRNNEHVYNNPRNYNNGPYKQSGPMYNQAREVKPLSNYQTNRRKPNYGPEMYGNGGNTVTEYTTGPAHVEEEISVGQDHGNYQSVGEMEHNHIHALPHHSIPHHKHHKINEIYEPVEHVPPYIPDFPSLGGPIGGIGGISSYPNPMELIYSSPYKLSGPPHPPYGKPPSSGYGARPLLSSASSQSSQSTSSNYGQFLSSLLSAYSLGSLKPSSKPSNSGGKGGLASYLNNLPGFDLLKGYSALSPSSYTSSLLTSASGLNKYYLPNPKQQNKQQQPNPYLGWPAEYAPQQQAQKPKPSGLLASSSNIVSSIDELFKSSLTSSNKFKRPAYSDVTRSITNLYKKLLN